MKGICDFAKHLNSGTFTSEQKHDDGGFTLHFGSGVSVQWSNESLMCFVDGGKVGVLGAGALEDAAFVMKQLNSFIECHDLTGNELNIMKRFEVTEYTPVFPVEDDAAARLQKLGLVRVEAGYAYITQKGKQLYVKA